MTVIVFLSLLNVNVTFGAVCEFVIDNAVVLVILLSDNLLVYGV